MISSESADDVSQMFEEPFSPLSSGARGGNAITVVIGESQVGQRLDIALTAGAGIAGFALSRSRAKALIEAGALAIDAVPIRDPNWRVRLGDTLVLFVPPAEDPEPEGESLPLEVVFEDDSLIVIDKPAGLVVHPAPGHSSGTLVNALIAHCGASLSGIGGVKRPGIVHRLDKDTSGLLVVAKTDAAHHGLSRLFADHGRHLSLTRGYLALVWGRPDRPFGTIEAPVGRHATDRLRMAVVARERGREATTHWRVRESFGATQTPVASLVDCRLETGRTHQIRVHMAHIGHPLMGDALYARGFRSKSSRLDVRSRESLASLGRQALHAAVLGFEHPVTKELLAFESSMPVDLHALASALRDADATPSSEAK